MTLKFTKKDNHRKRYPVKHHLTLLPCTINIIICHHQGAPRPLSAAAMQWREEKRGSWFASPSRCGHVAGWWHCFCGMMDRRETLACQEHQAFPDLAKPSMPRDQGGWRWTSSSTSPGRARVEGRSVVFSALCLWGSAGLGLGEFMTGGSSDDKSRNGKNRCEFPQFIASQRPPGHDISLFAKPNHIILTCNHTDFAVPGNKHLRPRESSASGIIKTVVEKDSGGN